MPLKILFVCTANKMRSKTAEVLFKSDERFIVKSAGVAEFAEVPLNLILLTWADYIVVMEEMHRQWIKKYYPTFYSQGKDRVFSLHIPDIYDYMDPQLIPLLRAKFETLYEEKLKDLES